MIRSIIFTKLLPGMEKLTKTQANSEQTVRITRSRAKNTETNTLEKFRFQTKPKLRKNNTSDTLPKTVNVERNNSSENEIKSEKPLSKPRKKRDHVKLEHEPESSKIKEELVDNDGCELPFKIKKEPEDNMEESRLSETDKKDIKLIKSEKDEKFHKMPLNWEVVLNNLREMRKNFDAPVDSMGCSKCHDENAPAKVSKTLSLF